MDHNAKRRIHEPLVLSDGGDLYVYESASALVAEVESIDVAQHVYEVFDSSGRVVLVEVKDARAASGIRTIFRLTPPPEVVLGVALPERNESSRLRSLIWDYLDEENGNRSGLSDESGLPDLIERLRQVLAG